ncbi:glycosyl transferase family 2 [Gillisia mitskevichiae]|uniref:Glycosyl transferase family 2 n=1 Tax=Gillisia mitskevichiae TaxID=270921 RepID=A0A495P8Q5_9FLAO|nr:glycosyltransferase [Gillisia mitskevichiae]RKS45139.1 glycosyl transferase family 2 [Gillisia mitskevichiae]
MDSTINVSPTITVIMPVYNSEHYVREAIESILSQTFTDFQFLIIDDASTDQTISIINSYKDPRINLIEKPKNTGYTKSLNLGLKIAKGKYIARMDSDDISLPKRFEKQISFLEANLEYMLCGTSYSVMGNDETILVPTSYEEIKLNLLWGNCIAHPTVMLRNEVFKKYHLKYDPNMEPSEDFDLWVQLLPQGKLHNLKEELLLYRMHNSSVSRQRASEQENTAIEVRLKLIQNLDLILKPDELNLLKRIFRKNEAIDVEDIKFFEKLKNKLKTSNKSLFFEPVGFSNYVDDLEKLVVDKFIFRYKRYNLSFYLDYIKAKKIINIKLKKTKEMHLFLKCLLFYKI